MARRVVIIGAGIGGLAAAAELATAGLDVTVIEAAATPGGKLRQVRPGADQAVPPIDAGPTVFTMRWVFEALFDALGTALEAELDLTPAGILARHAWGEAQLDLLADIDRSAEAIATFAGPAEARGYRRLCADSRRMFEILDQSFMQAAAPSLKGLIGGVGIGGVMGLRHIRPFTTLWQALGDYFRDQRLRQLFGRYATYCGSSPFLAPATLMLVTHVEQAGVWYVEGGMHRLAQALERLALAAGARFRYGTAADEIVTAGGAVRAVATADGERLAADAVICNADVAALAAGRLGRAARRTVAAVSPAARSLSAVTFAMQGTAQGFPLVRHNVFFSSDYEAEFRDILGHRRLPAEPTVYVCAEDRRDDAAPEAGRTERLFCLVNAPPTGDSRPFNDREIAQCQERMTAVLKRAGLTLEAPTEATLTTAPADFERLFPATGGALYGMASHGWQASFQRPGVRTRIQGLYLAGGSVHPGPGLPMATLSGRMAAAALMADHAST